MVVQTRQPEPFLRFSQIYVPEVGTGGVKGVQGQILPGTEPVLPGKLCNQHQQHSAAFPHALYIPQCVIVRIQHIRQGAEPLQQPVGNLVGIDPGQGVEQCQLQHFMLLEALQSLLQEFCPHPVPVAGVQALFIPASVTLFHTCSSFAVRCPDFAGPLLLLYRISV